MADITVRLSNLSEIVGVMVENDSCRFCLFGSADPRAEEKQAETGKYTFQDHFVFHVFISYVFAPAARLFREATQLETIAATIHVAGMEPRHKEIQVHATSATDRRRPVVTVVTDAVQRACIPMAVARGVL